MICAQRDRCVALEVAALRPPRPNGDVFRRTPSPSRAVFWLKVLATAAGWVPVVFVVRGLDTPGAPLLVFLGVPYAYVAFRATRAGWRVRNLGPQSMPWLP